MHVRTSVDVDDATGTIDESDLDARLVMLIVAAIVTSELEASRRTDESDGIPAHLQNR